MLFDRLEYLFKAIHDTIGQNFPVQIDAIRNAIIESQRGVHDIRYILSPDLVATRGNVIRALNPKTQIVVGEVYYSPNQNNCWQRFTKTKEMMHLGIDTKDEFVNSPKDIQALFAVVCTRFAAPAFAEFAPKTASELMAELAAVEVLFPLRWRHGFHLARTQKRPGLPTDRKIAELFRLPEVYVTMALETSYHQRMLEWAVRETPMRHGALKQIGA